MKEENVTLNDRRACEALTHLLAPDNLRTGGSPRFGERRTSVGAVAFRTKELRPVERRDLNHDARTDDDR